MSRMCVNRAKEQSGLESTEEDDLLRFIGEISSLEEIRSYCVTLSNYQADAENYSWWATFYLNLNLRNLNKRLTSPKEPFEKLASQHLKTQRGGRIIVPS